MENSPQEGLSTTERASRICETREDALRVVEGFWTQTNPEAFVGLEGDQWANELTEGDRTIIRKGVPSRSNERGKWVVDFLGNHQPLSVKAEQYLIVQGVIEKDEE